MRLVVLAGAFALAASAAQAQPAGLDALFSRHAAQTPGCALGVQEKGNAPTLQPSWAANDRNAHLMRAAEKMSVHRHMKNKNRIERAADRMAGRKSNELGRG